jgi:hypothetical protein
VSDTIQTAGHLRVRARAIDSATHGCWHEPLQAVVAESMRHQRRWQRERGRNIILWLTFVATMPSAVASLLV